MPKTALQMTPNEWKRYRPSAQNVEERSEQSPISHGNRKNALQVAKQAANVLREHFGAQKVVVFGSLATNIDFTEFSDIDLAAWGIPGNLYYKAVAAVTGFSERYKIDLIDPMLCRESIKKAILEHGVEL
ncbi:MAG: nucleotidyltransferase family protein [Dissulfuribacterales bacterium]